MFNFWKKRTAQERETGTHASIVDANQLRMLSSHFPIGRKLSYFPEFMREVIFPTIIIGYRVNGQFIYSHDDVELDAAGAVSGFRTGAKSRLAVEKLKSLQLLLPDTSDLEKKLDYFTRAELGRAGQFRTGNTITLQAENEARGIPTMDTVVERRQTLVDGPFADTATVLVSPQFESLTIADKRRKQRVAAMLSADLYLPAGNSPLTCTLCDFSEQAVRLAARGPENTLPHLAGRTPVEVEFRISLDESAVRIAGRVSRSDDDSLIVQVEGLLKEGAFDKPSPIDIVRIKTGLLNLRR